MDAALETLYDFLEAWKDDPLQTKSAFREYLEYLQGQAKVDISFKARPGISYSLRARHASQAMRQLFVLVDVVDDDPQERWLSVCFYEDMVTDPEELGDVVPQGLLGENARCFNLEQEDSKMRTYIRNRLSEALHHAAAGSA